MCHRHLAQVSKWLPHRGPSVLSFSISFLLKSSLSCIDEWKVADVTRYFPLLSHLVFFSNKRVSYRVYDKSLTTALENDAWNSVPYKGHPQYQKVRVKWSSYHRLKASHNLLKFKRCSKSENCSPKTDLFLTFRGKNKWLHFRFAFLWRSCLGIEQFGRRKTKFDLLKAPGGHHLPPRRFVTQTAEFFFLLLLFPLSWNDKSPAEDIVVNAISHV